MVRNLIAELVKIGVAPNAVTKTVAKTINVSERTARNKINGQTDWTLPEAMTINERLFHNTQRIEYLFDVN